MHRIEDRSGSGEGQGKEDGTPVARGLGESSGDADVLLMAQRWPC